MTAAVPQPHNIEVGDPGCVHQQLERLGVSLADCRVILCIKHAGYAVGSHGVIRIAVGIIGICNGVHQPIVGDSRLFQGCFSGFDFRFHCHDLVFQNLSLRLPLCAVGAVLCTGKINHINITFPCPEIIIRAVQERTAQKEINRVVVPEHGDHSDHVFFIQRLAAGVHCHTAIHGACGIGNTFRICASHVEGMRRLFHRIVQLFLFIAQRIVPGVRRIAVLCISCRRAVVCPVNGNPFRLRRSCVGIQRDPLHFQQVSRYIFPGRCRSDRGRCCSRQGCDSKNCGTQQSGASLYSVCLHLGIYTSVSRFSIFFIIPYSRIPCQSFCGFL